MVLTANRARKLPTMAIAPAQMLQNRILNPIMVIQTYVRLLSVTGQGYESACSSLSTAVLILIDEGRGTRLRGVFFFFYPFANRLLGGNIT